MTLIGWTLAIALQGPAPSPPAPQESGQLSVAVDAAYRPVVRASGALADPALADAARSGLPLRLRFRVELWRDAFFDRLQAGEEWTAVLVYQPLEERYRVRLSRGGAQRQLVASSFESARRAIESAYSPTVQPDESGRYYYTAELEVETLSLSDLEELERWLSGELEPAVRGEQPVPSAVGQGAKRLLIRVLGLPASRHTARSRPFTVR